MARPPRCLHSPLPCGETTLAPDQAHHLGRVLRLSPGDPVELVDGQGGWAQATWLGQGRVSVSEPAPRAPTPPVRVLAVAPPRPSRLEWLAEKAAELGVSRLALLSCEHAARDVPPKRLTRLRRKASEALLQCRRLHLMQVQPPSSLQQVLRAWGPRPVWLAAPPPGSGRPPPPPHGELLILVGPEGGFSADEQALARRHGAHELALGSGVLRVETAALAMAVLAGPT